MGHQNQGLYGAGHTTTATPSTFLRSNGPMSGDAANQARQTGMMLAFDPVQNGWLRADTLDDFDHIGPKPGWPTPAETVSRSAPVRFRPWTASDAPRFRTLLNNPNVWTYLPGTYPGDITMDMAADLIEVSNDTQLHIVRAIQVQDQPVGQVRLEFSDSEPELSYWLGQDYWGRGIGARAVAAFVTQCFADDPALDHLIARVKPDNIGSLRILEKAGFLREGRSNASPDWIILRRDRIPTQAA